MNIIVVLLSCLMFSVFAYPAFVGLQKTKNFPLIILLVIPTVYFSVGLLPLSSRRDYFEYEFWYFSLFVLNLAVLSGWWFASIFSRINFKSVYKLSEKRWFSHLPIAGIYISSIAAIAVVAQFGILALDPSKRFLVSSVYLYSIELGVSASILYIAQQDMLGKIKLKSMIFLGCGMALILTASGYRSQLALLICGVGLYFLLVQVVFLRLDVKKLSINLSIGMFVFLAILAVGYYMRVEFSGGDILSFEDRVLELDILAPNLLLPILPIHESARENIGVAYSAISRSSMISGFVNLDSFVWIELLTILPGYSQTSTGILGQVINNSDSAFLTPGVIGGLYISHGLAGVFIYFFLCAILVRFLWAKAIVDKDKYNLGVLAIFFVYYTHFMYRGIFRPMYFLVFIFIVFSLISVAGKYKSIKRD